MTESLVFLFASLLIFLVLTEVVTVRLIYGKDERTLIIDFMLFGIELKLPYKKRTKRIRDKKAKKKRKLPPIAAAKSAILYLLSKSNVTLNYLTVSMTRDEPSNIVLRQTRILSAVGAAFAIIDTYSKKFTYDNILIGISDNNKSELAFDIRIEVHVLIILASSLLFISKILASVFGEKKNVGKQNE